MYTKQSSIPIIRIWTEKRGKMGVEEIFIMVENFLYFQRKQIPFQGEHCIER